MSELFQKTTIAAGALLLAVALAACHRIGEPVIIPEKATAREQFDIAFREYQNATQRLVHREDREKAYRRVILSLEKVRERFPEDEKHTPLAALTIAEIYRERLNDMRSALKEYEWVYENCRYDDYLQAQSMVMAGICHEALGNPQRANKYYLECVDTYQDHPNKQVVMYVDRAQKLYDRVK